MVVKGVGLAQVFVFREIAEEPVEAAEEELVVGGDLGSRDFIHFEAVVLSFVHGDDPCLVYFYAAVFVAFFDKVDVGCSLDSAAFLLAGGNFDASGRFPIYQNYFASLPVLSQVINTTRIPRTSPPTTILDHQRLITSHELFDEGPQSRPHHVDPFIPALVADYLLPLVS